MSIRAILFDMDGVLIDAKEWHYEALNRALRLFGFEIPRSDHESRFDGLPTHTKLGILSAEGPLPESLHSFINRMKQRYTLDLAREQLVPFPQHIHALRSLRRAGYRLGVASNSVRASIDLMMELAGLSPYLDITLSNQDVRRPKPAPDIYRKAMHMIGVAPHECLVVEDHPFGWQAALSAGAHLLKVRDVHDVTLARVRDTLNALEATPSSTRKAA